MDTPQDTQAHVAALKKVIESKPRTLTGKDPSTPGETKEAKTNVELAKNSIDGVHLEMYRFFDITPVMATKGEMEKMALLTRWAFNGVSERKAMIKILDMEKKLGKGAEDRLSRIYNWVRIRYGGV